MMKSKFYGMVLILVVVLALALSACSGGSGSTGWEAAPAEAPDSAGAGWDDSDWGESSSPAPPDVSSESYLSIDENRRKAADLDSLVTLSLKVDTAAYSNVARYIRTGNLPPPDAVRTEDLVNYFRYEQEMKYGDDPFAIYTEVGPSPFHPDRHMAMIRVSTPQVNPVNLPPSNLTFLIDTSGSMRTYDKLPLLQQAFSMLVETLGEDDVVSVVTYAGSSGVALDSVSGADKDRILGVVNALEAGGSTAGESGIHTAYALAEKNFVQGGNNRIILASDGDFNVGTSDVDELAELVSQKRESGVYLSVLGFGTGNIRDDIMETLSAHGNGNYSYIDRVETARKVLVDERGTNLFTVAEDVKAQVEFNPANVKSYRLIGYENRLLSARDFEDDAKDAGEVGAGTDVVILFEVELQRGAAGQALKYGAAEAEEDVEYADELLEVRIRYKRPGEAESRLMEHPLTVEDIRDENTDDYRFACAVAAFGDLLRGSPYQDEATLQSISALAEESLGKDEQGYRADFLALLDECGELLG